MGREGERKGKGRRYETLAEEGKGEVKVIRHSNRGREGPDEGKGTREGTVAWEGEGKKRKEKEEEI